MRYGVLGVGSIARAIVTGLCEGVAEPPTVALSPRGAAASASLADRYPSVSVAGHNQAVLDGADLVLVCLRKRDADLLAELTWRPDQVAVSAMAGVPLARVAELVAPATAVRATPMPAVATRSGLTTVHPPVDVVLDLFDRLGEALPIEDGAAFEAAFTASGTVAPFFTFLDVLVDFMVERGVPVALARRLVAENFAGVVAPLAGAREPDFGELVQEYATPGGGNAQLTDLMHEAGVFDGMARSLAEVHRRLSGPG